MKFITTVLIILGSVAINAQTVCTNYTTVATIASAGYSEPSDPFCLPCVSPGTGGTGWTNSNTCTGTLVSTVVGGPVTTLTLAYGAVNDDDFGTITVDGGGVVSLSAVGAATSGNVVGPFNCSTGPSDFGDVELTVTSTLPFTTVTLTNTGCSSGWVIACPTSFSNAGPDLNYTYCSGAVDLNTLLLGADPGGTWTETSGSGQISGSNTIFNTNVVADGTYSFNYAVNTCGGTTDVSTININVLSIGNDTTVTICKGDILDLNSILVGASSGGTWVDSSNTGQIGTSNSIFNSTLTDTGTYHFAYELASCSSGQFAWITVNVVSPGADTTITVCDGIHDLNLLLNGESPGGIWVETSSSGQFNILTGVFNTDGLSDDIYEFQYILSECPLDPAKITVKLGIDTNCNDIVVPPPPPVDSTITTYNVFSPNDDGVNDFWHIEGIELHPINTVKVFSRWGDLLRSFENYNNNNVIWDGKYESNVSVPSSTYYYIIEPEGGQNQTGWVQVVK
jgi:gliding motility-associated-like protein